MKPWLQVVNLPVWHLGHIYSTGMEVSSAFNWHCKRPWQQAVFILLGYLEPTFRSSNQKSFWDCVDTAGQPRHWTCHQDILLPHGLSVSDPANRESTCTMIPPPITFCTSLITTFLLVTQWWVPFAVPAGVRSGSWHQYLACVWPRVTVMIYWGKQGSKVLPGWPGDLFRDAPPNSVWGRL